MKIFQIFNSFCHWDATPQYPTLQDTEGRFAPNIIFVEAPDYVFEGWGYDETQEGDARFIKPNPPVGFLYDDTSGTFYPEDGEPPKSDEQKIAELENQVRVLEGETKALKESNAFYEECLVEMAEIVYA